MTTTDHTNGAEREIAEAIPMSSLAVIEREQIDMQIATAKRFPRRLADFSRECMEMATFSPEIAGDCFYAIPRDGKTIEGPSARLAEIVMSAWRNCRVGARIVDEGSEFITAQGVFHDLERNVMVTMETQRRIVDKKGRRFGHDMRQVTAQAACSISVRNAIFRGVPRALWLPSYEAARKCAIGDVKSMVTKRGEMIAYFGKMGVRAEQILATLNVAGEEDIGLGELTTLRGLATAIKEGDTTIEQAFAPKDDATTAGNARGVAGLAAKLGAKTEPLKDEAAAAELARLQAEKERIDADRAAEEAKAAAKAKSAKPKPVPEQTAAHKAMMAKAVELGYSAAQIGAVRESIGIGPLVPLTDDQCAEVMREMDMRGAAQREAGSDE